MFISAVDFDILGWGSGDWFTFGARDHLSNCSFGTLVLAPFFSPGGCTSCAVHSFRFLSSFNVSTFHSPSWFSMNHFSFFYSFLPLSLAKGPAFHLTDFSSFDHSHLFLLSSSHSVSSIYFSSTFATSRTLSVPSLCGDAYITSKAVHCMSRRQVAVYQIPRPSQGLILAPYTTCPESDGRKRAGAVSRKEEAKHPSAFNSMYWINAKICRRQQMCMPLHFCVWMSVCVCVCEWTWLHHVRPAAAQYQQPILNFTSRLLSSSSSFFLSSSQPSVWPVFKRLQAPMKLDWVQRDEEHAREEYDIKCRAKHTPHIRHMHKDTQTLVSLTKSNIKTHRQTCESFGRKTKSLFANPFTFLTD